MFWIAYPTSMSFAQRLLTDALVMFIAYALHIDGPDYDLEVECADLDEALLHLRELITSEMAAPPHDAPHFERYGVRPPVA